MILNLDQTAEVTGALKDTVRKGWKLRKVENPESVADHSWGMSLLIMMLCPPELDRLKCLEFAIVHDLAESITGDYVPADNIAPETKHRLEMRAISDIAERTVCPQLIEIFAEYERMDTPEARFVKKIDKLDMVLQARYYDMHERSDFFAQKRDYNSLFEEFFANAEPFLQDILLK